uniref:Olfactory receptor n=1 Tax=Podarcis muralis TaxID=64176 RepID=A0A670HSN0_PODMU
MKEKNFTVIINEFVFVGLTNNLILQIVLFLVFLAIYIATLVGNLGLFVLIRACPKLHTPMYFFLSNLSLLDACFSSVVAPKTFMLVSFISHRKTISYSSCFTQLYFYIALATAECYLLAAMAYDRYVAVCNPLMYTVIMSERLCVLLVFASFVVGFLNATVQIGFSLTVSFGDSKVINHFFCDGPPLMKLACSDTTLNQILVFTIVGFNEVTTTSIVLISYTCIFSTIIRIRSNDSKHKAFSTCTSHLTAVSLFYGTLLFMYLRPSSSYSLEQDKIIAVVYTVLIPFVNPLIYSLRNKDVKDALIKGMERLGISR